MQRINLKKSFLKLMNNSMFGKTLENVRNHRKIKLVTKNKERTKLVSEPNFTTSKRFSEDLMAIEMTNTSVLMNKPVYFRLAILDLSKTLMYKFCYDYLKPKYKDKVKLCSMDTDSFVLHIQTKDFYVDINNDVDKWFDTSGYGKKRDRPITKRINKKGIGVMKDELDGKVMTEFCAPIVKTYAYNCYDDLENKDEEKKKAKGTKKCVIKKDLKLDDYKNSVLRNEVILRSQKRFKSDYHKVYTQEVNKIAIISNDDMKIQDFDRITIHAYGIPTIKVCESEMLAKKWDKSIAMYY